MAKTAKKVKPKNDVYLDALISVLRSQPKRKKPNALLAGWAKQEKRGGLKALFEAFAVHTDGGASVGDFVLYEGGRVPRENDIDRDRDDVVCIGATFGGDLYVIDAPGSERTTVTRLVHDDGFTEGDSFPDVNDLLGSCVNAAWEDDGTTSIDGALEGAGVVSPALVAKRAALAAQNRQNEKAGFALSPPPAGVTLASPSPRGAAATEFHPETRPQAVGAFFVGWDPAFKLAIVDAESGKKLDPGVEAYWYAGSPDGAHVLATGQGGIFEIDLAGSERPRLLSHARPYYAACYLGDRIAALFAGTGFSTSLEVYARKGSRLVALGEPTRCDGTKKLRALAAGRLLVVFDDGKSDPCHVLGVRGDELRLLGTVRGIEDAWDSTDGRACFVKTDKTVLELRDVDKVVASALAKPAKPLALKG